MPQSAPFVAPIEIIAVKVDQAATLIGVGRTTFYKLRRTDPTFPAVVKIGRASRVLVKDLQRWMAARATGITTTPRGSV